MIYQQFNFVRRLRVLDNVLIGCLSHLRGWRRAAALARVFDAVDSERMLRCLEHVGLVDRGGSVADTLSGGEDDWFDYRLEHHREFLRRIAEARGSLRSGGGVRLEDLLS